MAEGRGGGMDFPVVFYDGQREMNIGEVNISPTLEYKPFQHMVSRKIGISPNQISIYLADRPTSSTSAYEGRRIPITAKINFEAVISQRSDCCFLAVLKRSRGSRNRRERQMAKRSVDFGDYFTEHAFSSPENMATPTRDGPTGLSRRFGNEYDRLGSDRGLGSYSDPTRTMSVDQKKLYCEICEKSETRGPTTSFHHCVNDEMITGFVTRFGPIARPKGSRKKEV